MNKAMRYAGISGAVAVVLTAISLAIEVMELFGGRSETLVVLGAVISITYIIFAVMFTYGLILLGEKTKNRLLVYSAYAAIVVLVPGTLLVTLFEFYPVGGVLMVGFSLGFILLATIVGFALGAALLNLRKEFGNLAAAAGVLEIISGLFYLTLILAILGAFLAIIAMVLEVALLLKAAKKF